MSGLIGSILSTTNALKASQMAIETAGKNMSNVNNANYSRQRVEFGISGGISESIVTQLRDAITDSKISREASNTSSLDVQYHIGKQLQVIFGEQIVGDVSSIDSLAGSQATNSTTSGLSATIDQFFTSLHSLSASPTDIPMKTAVIAQAQEMTAQFNTLAKDLQSLDNDILRSVETEVNQVNTLLTQIANLNQEIAKIEIRSPGGALEYRDARQQKLEQLAGFINFETAEVANGQLLVFARDKDGVSGNEVMLVDRNTVTNQIRFNEGSNELYFSRHTVQPMVASPNDSAFNVSGGSLHGYLHMRSTTDPYGGAGSTAIGSLAVLRQDLDTLARSIAMEVSGVYDEPSNPPGYRFFFDDPTNTTAATFRLYQGDTINAIPPLSASTLVASASSNAGANELALALAQLRDVPRTELRGNSFNGFVSEMATSLGFDVSNSGQLLETQQLLTAQLKEQRAAVAGVSIDEELANMIRFQRSFEASARVLRVMDELLSLVVNGLVR
jgi:flagellar hook-associated protein 1